MNEQTPNVQALASCKRGFAASRLAFLIGDRSTVKFNQVTFTSQQRSREKTYRLRIYGDHDLGIQAESELMDPGPYRLNASLRVLGISLTINLWAALPAPAAESTQAIDCVNEKVSFDDRRPTSTATVDADQGDQVQIHSDTHRPVLLEMKVPAQARSIC